MRCFDLRISLFFGSGVIELDILPPDGLKSAVGGILSYIICLCKLGVLGKGKLKNGGEVTLHDLFEIVPGLAKTVIGETILGIVVGFDFFGAHASTDRLGALVGEGGKTFVFGVLPETGAEEVEGDFLVSGLVAFFADEDDNTGWLVGKADGSAHLVNVLTPPDRRHG